MKYILAISTLLLAFAAHAVRVGDRIEFEYTYETTSGASRGWSSRHVVDHWDQNYLLAEEFHLVGYSPSIYEKVYSHSEILTDDC